MQAVLSSASHFCVEHNTGYSVQGAVQWSIQYSEQYVTQYRVDDTVMNNLQDAGRDILFS